MDTIESELEEFKIDPENGHSASENDDMMVEEKIESGNSDDSNDEDLDDENDELEVKALEAALTENPYDYASHLALITKLQTMGELERLRLARNEMSSKYPLFPDLWLNWLKDEMKLAVSDEEKQNIKTLFERAVKDYLSVEIWLEYVQFSIGTIDYTKESIAEMRNLFERALTSVGLHVTKGAIIWEAFREFENVLVSAMATDGEKKEQINRLGSLFRRQLTCPLLDMEKTYEEFVSWRSNDGKDSSIDDKIVKANYERALNQLQLRLPFEEKIMSIDNQAELFDNYSIYIRYEKEHGDPGRTIVLYERAVVELSLDPRIWENYLNYLESTIKIETVLLPVYERATRNIPWYSKIWGMWMRAMEGWNRPLLEVQKLLENSLGVGFSSAEDYRNVWLKYLEYLRRRIDSKSDDHDKQLEIIREAFNRACEHLANLFGLEGDPQCVILQYWARTEAIHGDNMEKTRTLWADILSQGHSISASSWLEYITLEKCYGDTKHLKKLYQKALAAVKDWPESIANSWLDFERDEGNLEQIINCEMKVKERLDKVYEEREKLQKQQQEVVDNSPDKKPVKRKPEDTGRWKNLGCTMAKRSKIEDKTNVVKQKKSLDSEKQIEKKKSAPPPGYKPDNEPEKEENVSNHEVDEKITVFVSNLDYTATENEIRAVLEPVGPITMFKMVKDYKGRSKGFCYVQLTDAAAVEKALKLDRTPINGRPMFISRCDPDKTSRGVVFKYSCSLEKNKLFVKGIPVTKTKEDLEKIFQVYGKLKDIRLVTYRNGHSKGLAYVEFEDETSASKALIATDGMKLEDKIISVAISQPPERKKNSSEDVVPLQIPSLGGTQTSRNHFGVPKTMLSMVPRSVMSQATNQTTKSYKDTKPMNNQDFRSMLLGKK